MKYVALLFMVLSLLVGCSSRTVSNTPRTAVEQLLLSRAVDLALEKLQMPEAAGRTMYIDLTYLKSYDYEYVKVAVRSHFARLGAILVDKPEESDYICEVASGALGTEYKSTLVGVPGLPIPSSPVPLPEAPLYRKVEQTAIMKLLVFVHEKGKHIASGLYYARADRDESFLLWFRSSHRDQIREGWERADAELKQ